MNRERDSIRIPGATYRLQFHRGFTLAHAAELLTYLRDLGITDVYASPLFQAGAGSTHGYDVCCFGQLNAEVGGEEKFAAFSDARRKLGLGLLLDMVPNHMGAALSNGWWIDVLEYGPSSRYASFFDINWNPPNPGLQGKVLLPVLGDRYGKVLEAGELKLLFHNGKFFISYYERNFPVNPASLPAEFARHCGRPAGAPELDQALAAFNGSPGDARSFDALHRLIRQQHYRLAFWRVGPAEINYRRFFDVTELVSLRMERPEVFHAAHERVFEWLQAGHINGLRIDHPDGLRDPKEYLQRLQGNQPVYVVVEKILSGDERLPPDWLAHGTTGYDFLNRLNGIFVDAAAAQPMEQIYAAFLRKDSIEAPDFHQLLADSKRRILQTSLISELESLTHRLQAVATCSRAGMDFTFAALKSALTELISAFPVYRTYLTGTTNEPSAADRSAIEKAMAAARAKNAVDAGLLNFLRNLLTLELLPELEPDAIPCARQFVLAFQQLTGPVTAKGLEDTTFYNHHRLISLNEVGGDPARFGVSVPEFHEFNAFIAANWPHTLLATATHDTKRGEDARARINVLSEMPRDWADAVGRWSRWNADKRTPPDNQPAPTANDEYLLYQSLVGALPPNANDPEELDRFRNRAAAFMLKAVREAKANTSWLQPNEGYETAVDEFTRRVLTGSPNNPFLDDLRRFVRHVSFFGRINSLAQTVLKLTAPGVPDTYQGTELWDFSFVDPDNRRPVDFQERRRLLAEIQTRFSSDDASPEMPSIDDSGVAKLFVIWRTLQLRRQLPELFRSGAYVPLSAEGSRMNHVVAFARTDGHDSIIVIAPRLPVQLVRGEETYPLGETVWSDTQLRLNGESAGRRFRNAFTGEWVDITTDAQLPVKDVLKAFPVAVLVRKPRES